MSNIKLAWLGDELMGKVELSLRPGWDTYTSPTVRTYNPVGILNHHTAGSSILYNYPDPPYWTNDRLKNSCNITIRPDGVVALLNAGYAYDSGMGDPKVLAALLRDEEVGVPTDFNTTGRISGNAHFIDIEVQHLGNGDPINPPQRAALITTNAVICAHYGWNPMTRILGHRDWTLRKIDPRWSGSSNPMHAIRVDTALAMEGGDDMPTTQEIAQAIWSFPVPQVGAGVTAQLALARATNLSQATFNLLTVDSNTVNDAELDAAVSSLLDSLPDAVVAKIANRLAPGPA